MTTLIIAITSLLPMREWCGCGAAVRGTRRDVLAWRAEHRHSSDDEPAPMVPPTGASSSTETSWQPIGFVPDMA